MFKGLQAKAGAAQGNAAMMGESAGLAPILGKLAAVAGVVAGAVAAIGLLVKILIDADEQTKDFNKSIIEAGGSAQFFTAGMKGLAYAGEDVGDALETVRKVITDVKFNMGWRIAAEQHLEVLNGFQEANLSIGAMLQESGQDFEAYEQSLMDAVLMAHHLLGTSTSEVAKEMGKWVTEFGYTKDGAIDAMNQIAVEAQMSGINTKKFFALVQANTPTLALYGMRVGEVSALLSKLGKALGPDQAEKALSGLTEMFRGEDIQTNMKHLFLAGTAGSRAMEASVKRADVELATMATELGIKDYMGGKTPKERALKLYAEIQAKMKAAGGGKEADILAAKARRAGGAALYASGAAGGMSSKAMVLGQGDLTGRLAMKAAEFQRFGIRKLEDLTNLNGDQALQLQAAGVVNAEQLASLQMVGMSLISKVGKGADLVDAIGYLTDEEVKATSDMLKKPAEATASNTESIFNWMKTIMQGYLSSITESVEGIYGWLFGSDLRDTQKNVAGRVKEERRQMEGDKDPQEKKKHEMTIAALRKVQAAAGSGEYADQKSLLADLDHIVGGGLSDEARQWLTAVVVHGKKARLRTTGVETESETGEEGEGGYTAPGVSRLLESPGAAMLKVAEDQKAQQELAAKSFDSYAQDFRQVTDGDQMKVVLPEQFTPDLASEIATANKEIAFRKELFETPGLSDSEIRSSLKAFKTGRVEGLPDSAQRLIEKYQDFSAATGGWVPVSAGDVVVKADSLAAGTGFPAGGLAGKANERLGGGNRGPVTINIVGDPAIIRRTVMEVIYEHERRGAA